MRLIDVDRLIKVLGITDMDCDKCAWGNKSYHTCNRGSDFADACSAIEEAPAITIEGYDMDVLIGIAVEMRKEGVTPMEALRIFDDAKKTASLVVEEISGKINDAIEKLLEE